MHVKVKICGITDRSTIEAAAILGVDALGFVVADSPRQLTIARARTLIAEVPPFITSVVVMRNPSRDEVAEVRSRIDPDLIQAEPPPDCDAPLPKILPVFHDGVGLSRAIDYFSRSGNRGAIHLEGPGRGGRGISVDLARAAHIARSHRIILAGGLNAENVGRAIEQVRPYGVDVSSGVESAPGLKDKLRMAEFMAAVRSHRHVIAKHI